MKVGKAIYNILSQSTEVQSNFPFNTTDYSPTGTELVTNGDFSATGTELVTNGNFATDSNWIKGTGWTISGGSANCDGTQASNSNLYQDVFTVSKSYKTTLDVIVTAGTLYVYTGTPSQTITITSSGTYDFSGLSSSSTALYIQAQSDFVGSVSNVSVKELGEGWTLVGDFEIGDTKALITNATQYSQLTQQQGSVFLSQNKNYKLQADIETLSISNAFAYRTTGGSVTPIATSEIIGGKYTTYFTMPTDGYIWFQTTGSFTGLNVSITNISVEEMVLNKIFPELAPPDIDAPYIVYSVVSNSPSETKNTNGDIDTASIEVYGFQDTYNKAVDLGVSVRAALDRKTGTYNTIEIQSTNYVNEQMDVNEARKLWAAIQDYSIRIKNL